MYFKGKENQKDAAKTPKIFSLRETNKTILEIGSSGTWNQEMDFSRIVKHDSDNEISNDAMDDIPPLEYCECD